MATALTETRLDGVPLFARGKVRVVYDLEDRLLIVATDRISFPMDCRSPAGWTSPSLRRPQKLKPDTMKTYLSNRCARSATAALRPGCGI